MPWDTLKSLMNGSGDLERIKGKEWILIKLISFSDLEKAERINRYNHKVNNEIIRALIYFEAKDLKQFPKWLGKKSKKDLLDKLILKYCEMFGIPKKELFINYDLIIEIVKTDLKQFLKELGESEETFKKFGIKLEKPKVKTGLSRWFD